MTPSTVDVKDVKVLNPDGIEYGDSTSALRSRNKVLAQKLNSETGSLYKVKGERCGLLPTSSPSYLHKGPSALSGRAFECKIIKGEVDGETNL